MFKEIIAFTGAGISKDSGLPTFDEQPGIREKLTRDYANQHPDDYQAFIQQMYEQMEKASPNDAHYALAEYRIPIISMNIDFLHERAGSQSVLKLHGEYPNIVLYGDEAPNYAPALKMVKTLPYKQSLLLVVGISFYTAISRDIQKKARQRGAKIVVINEDAKTQVRNVLKHFLN